MGSRCSRKRLHVNVKVYLASNASLEKYLPDTAAAKASHKK